MRFPSATTPIKLNQGILTNCIKQLNDAVPMENDSLPLLVKRYGSLDTWDVDVLVYSPKQPVAAHSEHWQCFQERYATGLEQLKTHLEPAPRSLSMFLGGIDAIHLWLDSLSTIQTFTKNMAWEGFDLSDTLILEGAQFHYYTYLDKLFTIQHALNDQGAPDGSTR